MIIRGGYTIWGLYLIIAQAARHHLLTVLIVVCLTTLYGVKGFLNAWDALDNQKHQTVE